MNSKADARQGFLVTYLPTVHGMLQWRPRLGRRATRFIGRLVVVFHFSMVGLFAAIAGNYWMWQSTVTECSTIHKHFVPWGDEWGYECFYETPLKAQEPQKTDLPARQYAL